MNLTADCRFQSVWSGFAEVVPLGGKFQDKASGCTGTAGADSLAYLIALECQHGTSAVVTARVGDLKHMHDVARVPLECYPSEDIPELSGDLCVRLVVIEAGAVTGPLTDVVIRCYSGKVIPQSVILCLRGGRNLPVKQPICTRAVIVDGT